LTIRHNMVCATAPETRPRLGFDHVSTKTCDDALGDQPSSHAAGRGVGFSLVAVPESWGRNVTLGFFASGPLEYADEWANAKVSLPTKAALDMLAFLGLDRDVFGACDASDLAARVRRALWPSRRAPEAMLPSLRELLDLAERAHGGLVVYVENP
jgi:hypothetical protein